MSVETSLALINSTFRQKAANWCMKAPLNTVVEFHHPDRRTPEQNDRMHAMARDLSKQVPYMGMTLSVEQWKRFATAKLKKDTMIFDCDDLGQPSPQLGLIVLGAYTRDMRKADVGAVIDWFFWMGAQHDVRWTDPKAQTESGVGT